MLARPGHEPQHKVPNQTMDGIVDNVVLPTYLSIVLRITFCPVACNRLATRARRYHERYVVSFSDQVQQFVVSERDNECAWAHN